MIMDEVQMVELIKLLQTNPQAAAKALAASGLTPDQVLNIGNMGIGQIAAQPGEAPISAQPPRYMSTFEGPAVRTDLPPSDKFTLPAEGEVPMPKPVVTTNAMDDPNMDYLWNQALPIETAAAAAPQVNGWSTTVQPATPAGPQQPGFGSLMAGLKPPQSSDTRPIFGANAPAPPASTLGAGAKAASAPAGLQQLLQLMLQGGGRPTPTIGALMGRG